MTGNGDFHIGNMRDFYHATGDGAVGRIEFHQHGAQDPQAVYEAVIRAIETLRGQVSAEDREVLDTSLETIRQGDEAPPGAFRRALGTVSGVAALVGEVGVPVAEAVRRLLALLAG
ncbi:MULTISPECIES: hypothetical protein [Streptomyces]|uniref:Uncharacterized protein n=1 Tax=Streptomyces nymphaeiformis TaxID=2663842 RepID=A0A7W7U0P7_9ACTN|nr:hypothetical protein [Streptomyces nymphaeiformis]MBB4982855.1 hypothetical protein [Streptomyces nymphaeiformis]